MVGSHFVEAGAFKIAAAGRTDPMQHGLRVERFEPVDLARPEAVVKLVRSAPEPVIVNFAARTDVDPIEMERPLRSSHDGPAWTVNALAPAAIGAAARSSRKYFVQLSTDYVFDGTMGPYGEDFPRSRLSDNLSWYGWTKSEGERLSSTENPNVAIVRISYPYRASFEPKSDFARWIIEMHRKGTLPPLYSNQQITPTWVPDVTHALQILIRRHLSGIFHLASPEVTTPMEFGRELLTRVDGSAPQLVAGSLKLPATGSGVAPRPIRGGLLSRRTTDLGISSTSWRQGIRNLVEGKPDL